MKRVITLRQLWLNVLLCVLVAIVGAALGSWTSDTAIAAIYFPVMFAAILTLFVL